MHSTNTLADHRLSLDHIAHFLLDMDAASVALSGLGFSLTPFSAQSHRPDPNGALLPAGTANRCVMLQDGYFEFLTPTHDTANARQLHSAIARYTGVHLIAFGTQTPEADYTRLAAEGFSPLSPLALQRQVGTESGEAIARFTVVRVAPDSMVEGRIQYCQHHTPDVVWQPRWLKHANHATGLAGVLLCVEDPAEAARRYGRYTGLPVQQTANAWRLDTDRGYLLFLQPSTLQQSLAVSNPALPWIAGYVIDSDDLDVTRTCVGGRPVGERICVDLPDAVGGLMIFQAEGSSPLEM